MTKGMNGVARGVLWLRTSVVRNLQLALMNRSHPSLWSVSNVSVHSAMCYNQMFPFHTNIHSFRRIWTIRWFPRWVWQWKRNLSKQSPGTINIKMADQINRILTSHLQQEDDDRPFVPPNVERSPVITTPHVWWFLIGWNIDNVLNSEIQDVYDDSPFIPPEGLHIRNDKALHSTTLHEVAISIERQKSHHEIGRHTRDGGNEIDDVIAKFQKLYMSDSNLSNVTKDNDSRPIVIIWQIMFMTLTFI